MRHEYRMYAALFTIRGRFESNVYRIVNESSIIGHICAALCAFISSFMKGQSGYLSYLLGHGVRELGRI